VLEHTACWQWLVFHTSVRSYSINRWSSGKLGSPRKVLHDYSAFVNKVSMGVHCISSLALATSQVLPIATVKGSFRVCAKLAT